MVERASWDAEAAQSLQMPSVTAGLGVIRTDEPMQAFGLKLNQARIASADFMPAALNHPDPVTGTSAYVTLSQPLYAGGRLEASRRAGQALAGAEASMQIYRRQQVAYAVVQAYFGTVVAEQGLRYAEDQLRQAEETERFVRARVEQGLLLKSEGERARAFRAQAQAGVAEARQRLASARSGLLLLLGSGGESPVLVTPVEAPEEPAPASERGDLRAARFHVEVAREGAKAAQGNLKPEVGLALTAGTARYTWGDGGHWTSVVLGAKWTFSFAETSRVKSARASARAAELGLQWQRLQASREVEEAKAAVETSRLKIEAAHVALEASELVRTIRTARHREGLLPLTEVLDAESGLSGARTLLLNSQLEWRLSVARRDLAMGHPVEGVKE